MPSLWSGYSSSPDIIVHMHTYSARLKLVELGKQFREGHEYSARQGRATSTHVYTWPNAKVACSINLYHLLRHKGNALHGFEYTVTVSVDKVVTDRIKAGAEEIIHCNSFVITPIQQLTASQGGLYEIQIVERQIKPFGYDDIDWSTPSTYKVDFLCYPDRSCQLVERSLLHGSRDLNHIAPMSWKLWEREARREVTRLQSDREYHEAEDRALREDEASRSSTRLLSRISRPASASVERQHEVVSGTHQALIAAPSRSLSERLQVRDTVKMEATYAGTVPEICRPPTTPPMKSFNENFIASIAASSTLGSSKPGGETLLPVSDKGQKIKSEADEDNLFTSGISTPPVIGSCSDLDGKVEALAPVETENSDREAEISQSKIMPESIVPEESIGSEARIDSSSADVCLPGEGDESSLERRSVHQEEPVNHELVDVEEHSATDGPLKRANERKRSVPTEDTLHHRRRKLDDIVAKRLILEAETIELLEAEEVDRLKRAEKKNRDVKRRAAERERFYRQGQAKEMQSSQDPRSVVASDTSSSQRNVATWVDGETIREVTYQGELPDSPISMQSPQIVHSGSPPHHQRLNPTVAFAMPAPSLPKPLMSSIGAQGRR